MKKLLLALLGALLFMPTVASALVIQGPQTFYIDLLPTGVTSWAGSGTTTAYAKSMPYGTGVSTLFMHGNNFNLPDNPAMYSLGTQAGTTMVYETQAGVTRTVATSADTVLNVPDLGPYGTVQITGATPCQASRSIGSDAWSGVTLEFGVYGTTLKATDEQSARSWAAAERIPLWRGAYNSGDSPYAFPIELPANITMARFYLAPSGVTPIGNFRAKVTLGLPRDNWQPPQPLLIKEGTFTMPLDGTGVSQFTTASICAWPDGVGYAEAEIVSGTSCYMTKNGDTPAVGTATPLYLATTLGLSANEMRDSKWITGETAVTVRFRLYSRKF